MNTLDEVIKALEMCTADNCVCLYGCPYSHLADGDDGCEFHAIPAMQTDALYYCKEYKRDKEELNSTRLAYLDILTDYAALKQYWAEQQENHALTWDELKNMIGKPVYVECEVFPSRWFLIEEIGVNDSMICVGKFAERIPLHLETMGTMWNAYRRNENEIS